MLEGKANHILIVWLMSLIQSMFAPIIIYFIIIILKLIYIKLKMFIHFKQIQFFSYTFSYQVHRKLDLFQYIY